MKLIYKLACVTAMLASSALAQAEPPSHDAAKPQSKLVDCAAGQSLQPAISRAHPGDVLELQGSCSGPIQIAVDRLTLRGHGSATISGGAGAAVAVQSAQAVVLSGLTISGAQGVGVQARDAAQLTLIDVNVIGNVIGIELSAASSVRISAGQVSQNQVHGIDVQGSSALTLTGHVSVADNGVFGININGASSLTLAQAKLDVTGNTLGIQLGTTASGFISDDATQLNASNNRTDGLTVVSGSHFVAFGGQITCNGNGIHGISINSKAGFDLDGAAQVVASDNKSDGLHLEQNSVATFFNNPAFTQKNTPTTLAAERNGAHGIELSSGSVLTVNNYARLQLTDNMAAGLTLDDGSSAAFTQSIPVSDITTEISGNSPDVRLSFGSRLSSLDNVVLSGTAECDKTVLTRGPVACR